MLFTKVALRLRTVSRYAMILGCVAAALPAAAATDTWAGLRFGLADPLFEPMGSRADVANQLGVNIIRKVIRWQKTEPYPGIYDYTYADEVVAEAEAHGMTLIFVLGYGHKYYTGNETTPPKTEAQLRGFAEFARRVADRYKGHKVEWEVWNEPNSAAFWGPTPSATEYSALLNVTAPKLKEGNPDAVIYAPSMGGYDLVWLDEFLKQPFPKEVTYWSTHPYSETSPESWHTLNWMKTLQARLYNSNIPKLLPIAFTEWSYLAPKSVTYAQQANWQSRIPLVMPWLVDTLGVFYGIQGPAQSWDPSENSAGLLDAAGQPRETYFRYQFLAPHVAGSSLTGRIKWASGDNVWTMLMRTPEGKPTIISWGREVNEATPFQSAMPTYQVGRTTGDYQTVTGDTLSTLTSNSTPMVISSSADDPLWGPLSTIGRLPSTMNIGYSKTREQVCRQIFDSLFNSQLDPSAVVEFWSGPNTGSMSMGTLRRIGYSEFQSRLELMGISIGDLTENSQPLSVKVRVNGFAPVEFDLGPNTWPASIRYQIRTLEPMASMAGTKNPRIAMSSVLKFSTGTTRALAYRAPLYAGDTTFQIPLGTSEGKRTPYSINLMDGRVSAAAANNPPRDVRLLSFTQGGPAYSTYLAMNQIWTKDTCTIEKVNSVPSPAGTYDSLKIKGTQLVDGVLRIVYGPGTMFLPAGTKRIDMWVFPKGPVRQVDLTVRDIYGKVYFMPKQVRVIPGQWNLVQMQIPQVAGGTAILHDIFRVFPEPGSIASDLEVTIGEVRVYAS
jgi:hypothetical protein